MTAAVAMAAGSNVVKAQGLYVHAGTQALLRDLSVEIAAGERIAIVGHNGAGKSTLLKALSAFASADRGRLQVLDVELSAVPGRRLPAAKVRGLRSRVAQVLQGLHLVGRLSVLDNVLIGGAARCPSWLTWLRRWPAGERRDALAALQRVGMAWAAGRRTDSLSGGERQKVAIARALHQGGAVLLADEPTASLDADAADEVIELLRSIADERKATLICVLHDLDRVPRIAERALVLRRGQLIADLKVDANSAQHLRGILT